MLLGKHLRLAPFIFEDLVCFVLNLNLTYLYKYAVLYSLDNLYGVVFMNGKTSTESKRRYNKSAYTTHLYVFRKNSELAQCILEFKSLKGSSLNYLITKLLSKHFDVPIPIPETDSID